MSKNIAVYGISKNEEKHVERFVESAKDADCICILDTGSEDRTVNLLKSSKSLVFVKQQSIDPWRFDTARNESLKSVPEDIDICISMDLDEVLQSGWRKELEKSWVLGVTRAQHEFIDEGRRYKQTRIHARHHYLWRNKVHEELYTSMPEVQIHLDFAIEHLPDKTKSRAQYLDLIIESIGEDRNQRMMVYLICEYMNRSMYLQALDACRNALTIRNGWMIDRCYISMLAAECAKILNIKNVEEYFMYSAIVEAPDYPDPWYLSAQYFFDKGDYDKALSSAIRCIRCSFRQVYNTTEMLSRSARPYLIAALSAQKLGKKNIVQQYFNEGIFTFPEDRELTKHFGEFLSS